MKKIIFLIFAILLFNIAKGQIGYNKPIMYKDTLPGGKLYNFVAAHGGGDIDTNTIVYSQYKTDSLLNLKVNKNSTLNTIYLDTFLISSADILAGDSIAIADTNSVLQEVLIWYNAVSTGYTSAGTDSIKIYGEYNNVPYMLAYISDSYLNTVDKKGFFPIAADKVDWYSHYWMKIPNQYTLGDGYMRVKAVYKKVIW